MILRELLSLNEIFTSTVNLSWKQISKSTTIAEFEVDEKAYECFIEAGTYEFNDHKLTFLNIGFSRILNGEKFFDLTLDTQNAVKVLGAIINGVSKKIDEYDADAIMLSAVDNVNQRMNIYKWIARKFSSKFGVWIKSVKVPNGEVTLLISSKLDKELVNKFIEHVKSKNLEK